MDKETLIKIFNTLNELEVKGYDNMNRLFGVMHTIKTAIEKEENK